VWRSRSKNREGQGIKTCCCVFSFVAGNDGPHSRQRREEKKKAGQIHPFPGIACGGA